MKGMFALIVLLLAAPANALCIYRGVDNAHSTVSQEFADAQWVVRARVVSAQRGEGQDGPWISYRLKPIESFKGQLTGEFDFFSYRNSGGFYMDRALQGPDIGGDYILFLRPRQFNEGDPVRARSATFVTYNCGRSGPWTEMPGSDRQELRRLSGRQLP